MVIEVEFESVVTSCVVCADRCDRDHPLPIASTIVIATQTSLTSVADVPGLAFIVIILEMSAGVGLEAAS